MSFDGTHNLRITNDINLWNHTLYSKRYDWPKRQVDSSYRIPPQTETSEKITFLPKGTLVKTKELLYDSNLSAYGGRYQILLVEANIDGSMKEGFIFSIEINKLNTAEEINTVLLGFDENARRVINFIARKLGIDENKDVLNAAARQTAIDFIENNIWGYYRGYQFWGSTLGEFHLLVPKKFPEKGDWETNDGFYDVHRTMSSKKIQLLGKNRKPMKKLLH